MSLVDGFKSFFGEFKCMNISSRLLDVNILFIFKKKPPVSELTDENIPKNKRKITLQLQTYRKKWYLSIGPNPRVEIDSEFSDCLEVISMIGDSIKNARLHKVLVLTNSDNLAFYPYPYSSDYIPLFNWLCNTCVKYYNIHKSTREQMISDEHTIATKLFNCMLEKKHEKLKAQTSQLIVSVETL